MSEVTLRPAPVTPSTPAVPLVAAPVAPETPSPEAPLPNPTGFKDWLEQWVKNAQIFLPIVFTKNSPMSLLLPKVEAPARQRYFNSHTGLPEVFRFPSRHKTLGRMSIDDIFTFEVKYQIAEAPDMNAFVNLGTFNIIPLKNISDVVMINASVELKQAILAVFIKEFASGAR